MAKPWRFLPLHILAESLIGFSVYLVDVAVLEGAPSLALVPVDSISGRTKQLALAHVQRKVLPNVYLSPPELTCLQLTDVASALRNCRLYLG